MTATRTGFQGLTQIQPAPAMPGDFASANPRASVLSPPGGFRVAPAAVIPVGNFAWFSGVDGLARGAATANSVVGFVHRENQTIITDYLGFFRETIQEGFPVAGHTRGDFWAEFPNGAAVDATVYADSATGAPTTTSGGNVATAFKVKTAVPVDAVFTAEATAAQFAAGLLNVTAVASGAIVTGQFISGTNVPSSLNVQILNQVSGAVGGIGVYQTTYVGPPASAAVTIPSATVTGVQGKLAKISTW